MLKMGLGFDDRRFLFSKMVVKKQRNLLFTFFPKSRMKLFNVDSES